MGSKVFKLLPIICKTKKKKLQHLTIDLWKQFIFNESIYYRRSFEIRLIIKNYPETDKNYA